MDAARERVVFFDLDDTLYDRRRSHMLGVSAVQRACAELLGRFDDRWDERFCDALALDHVEQLITMLTGPSIDTDEIRKFLATIDFPETTCLAIIKLRVAYKEAISKGRRATPGSIELLARLRDNGYRIGIITNAATHHQLSKAADIGVLDLVDEIISSEDVGCAKPDARIFEYAIEKLGAPLYRTYMIGDSVSQDIRGALGARLRAILYKPAGLYSGNDDHYVVMNGKRIRVVRHMDALYGYLGLHRRRYEPRFTSNAQGGLVVEGLGMDLVLAKPLRTGRLSQGNVRFLAQCIGEILVAIPEGRLLAAVPILGKMIKTIEGAPGDVPDVTAEHSVAAEDGGEVGTTGKVGWNIVAREYSICVEFQRLVFDCDKKNQLWARLTVSDLHYHFQSLMEDNPAMAARNLARAMELLSGAARIEG